MPTRMKIRNKQKMSTTKSGAGYSLPVYGRPYNAVPGPSLTKRKKGKKNAKAR